MCEGENIDVSVHTWQVGCWPAVTFASQTASF